MKESITLVFTFTVKKCKDFVPGGGGGGGGGTPYMVYIGYVPHAEPPFLHLSSIARHIFFFLKKQDKENPFQGIYFLSHFRSEGFHSQKSFQGSIIWKSPPNFICNASVLVRSQLNLRNCIAAQPFISTVNSAVIYRTH